ncbi:hypothetical protein Q5P01_023171 [Channa striata]|uniref:FAM234A/B beta-propeller domain-containing protein n=1 Tax=Channa striata TaxID=64152 RepID=A0AA88IVW7_CHASR|nr:hypothetical protein Q5P01_023171 [Channa striata]
MRESSPNKTCAYYGLPSPCLFVLAVDGTDGDTLWECALQPEFHWAQCGLQKDTGRKWDCLVSHSQPLQFTAIDKHTGQILWRQHKLPDLKYAMPVLSVPDLDGDKVGDVALVASDPTQTELVFLSGKTGEQIGSRVSLGSTKIINHRLYYTTEGSYYVLLQQESGLYGLSLWSIAAQAKAGMESSLKKDKRWEKNASGTSGLVTIYKSDSMKQVVMTEETDEMGQSNLLLVSGNEVALIGGKDLQLLWRFNTTSVLSQPSFGHFNKDGVLDIVIEDNIGNSTKREIILDGKSGGVLWEVNLFASPNSPRPDSIHTTNFFSIFVFWGVMPSAANFSVPLTSDQRSYLLHPLYSKVLLESTNDLDNIISFRATLMERGRHAAYILLTSSEKAGAEGTVVLRKQKLKHEVPFSKVLRTGPGEASATSEDIKEAFNRLRFSDW